MKLEEVNVNDLKELKQNVRLHGDVQIKELKRSLEQFGQTRAVVIDEDNNILIGNGLHIAMKELGWEKCQCFRKTGLSEKEKKKLIVTDNKVFTLGIEDYDGINAYLSEITSAGDFDIAGFDPAVLEETFSFDDNDFELATTGCGGFSEKDEPMESIEPQFAEDEPEEQIQSVERKEPEVNYSDEEETSGPASYAHEHTTRKIICPSCGEVIIID